MADRRPIVILMRYSIIKAPTATSTGWLAAKTGSYEDYKSALLAPARLKERLNAFTNIVLPSLLAQTLPLDAERHCLVIMTSTEAPRAALDALAAAVAPYPWILLRPVPPRDDFPFVDCVREALARMDFASGVFATVRLDDDDALARSFVRKIEDLIVDENVGKAVTFPAGFYGKFDHGSGQFTEFYRSNKRFLALGLTAIHRLENGRIAPAERPTVFHFGRHPDIAKNGLPYIEDKSFPAYLRSIYPTQDSASRSRDMYEHEPVTREMVAAHVGLAPNGRPPLRTGDAGGWLGRVARRLGLRR